MAFNLNILLEGTYNYFSNGINYSQENFKLVHALESQTYYFASEILSRIETGEFLKILVRYELNANFIPVLSRVEKFLGTKYAMELFKLDLTNMGLHYTFQNSNGSHEFTRSLSPKHYLSSPAVCTSAVFTLTKKFDTTGRTPVVVVSSSNDWTYEGPPAEKVLFADYNPREISDFKLNNLTLSANQLSLYEHDSLVPSSEKPVELFLSKHYSVPYQLLHGNQQVTIKNLKRHDQHLK